MSATVEDLDFLAPAVAGMPQPDKEKALAMAATYRPACLPASKQDEAQLLYAAWLLYGRLQQQDGGVAPAGVISEKEGDLQRTYGRTEATADPLGFHARWKALNDLCGFGAITVGRSVNGCCPRY